MTETQQNLLLKHIFQNADWADIGDAAGLRGSSSAGSLYIALFNGDPEDTGTEVSYTGYERAAVARSAAGWDVTDDEASNAARVDFPECTAGSDTATHTAVYTAASGGSPLFKAQAPSSLAISQNIAPYVAAGALTYKFN